MPLASFPVNKLLQGFDYVALSCYSIMFIFQLPWIIYFILNIVQEKKVLSQLVRNGNQPEDLPLITKRRNKLLLYKYMLATTIFEASTVVFPLIDYIIVSFTDVELNCDHYYYIPYLYASYLADVIKILLYQCILEMLNLTTQFVKDVYLRNSARSVMRKKINRFVLRFLLVLGLGVSGVGLGIAYVICEVFLITQLVLYYRYSRQLYRALRMHYEDTKYEFGNRSVEARTIWRHMRHYKNTTIWFFIIAAILVWGVAVGELSLPYEFLESGCIQQLLTNHNLTFINSTVFQVTDDALSIVSLILYLTSFLALIPFYTVFSLYYLCNKFLFVKKYKYRYHVKYSQGYRRLILN